MYVYIYVYICIYIHTHTHTHTLCVIYTYIYVCVYIYIYCVCLWMHIYLLVSLLHTRRRTHLLVYDKYAYVQAHTAHTRTCVRVQALGQDQQLKDTHTHTHTHTHKHKRAQALGKDKELKDQEERMQNHALHLASLAAERHRALEEVPQCVFMCPCVSPQPWPLASIAAPRSSPLRHLYSLSGWVRSLPSALSSAQPGSALRLR